MAWYTHIEQTAKGNKKLGFLKRNFKFNNPDIKSRTYKTLVRPTLKYCSTVWDPHTAKAALQLEIVQCRSARWVKNDYLQQSSVTQKFIDLKWQDLAKNNGSRGPEGPLGGSIWALRGGPLRLP